MKKAKILLSLLLGVLMAVSVVAFAACEPDKGEPVLEFVAADKTNWDKEVTLGEKKFKMALALYADKTIELKATCTGKAESGGQGGGPGGPGGSGDSGDRPSGGQGGDQGGAPDDQGGAPGDQGGAPGDQGGAPVLAKVRAVSAEAGEEETPEEEVDYSVFSFTVGGNWSEEAGWGYTVKFDDTAKTEIAVNYDTTMGRHYFYYYMSPTIDGEEVKETQVQFQAKDSAYRKTLDKSYVIHEERVATYMFRGGGFDGMTGNKAEARFYLMPNNSVVAYTESGSTLTYDAKGNWTEDKTAKTVSVTVSGTTYTTDAYCDAAGKQGYRMPYSSYALYCAVADGMTWDQYVSADFEGATIVTLTGGDYTLELTEKGYANIIKNKAVALGTKYTKDADGNYQITTKYGTYTSVKNGDTLTFNIHITVKTGNGPDMKEEEVSIDFTGPAV